MLAAGAVAASAAGGPPDGDRGAGQGGGPPGHGHGGGGRQRRRATAVGGGGHGPGHGGGGHGGSRPPVKPPTAIGTKGAAATVDVLATDAAIDMLRKGGNAVDAAVAAAGVLGVTEPFSAGIGGGGFMVIRTRHGKVTTIDGRETAPRGDDAGLVLRERGAAAVRRRALERPVRGRARHGGDVGVRARALRHQVAAQDAGSRASTSPARGFPVDQTFFDQTAPNVDFFDDVPSTAAIYLDPDGTPKDVGTTLRNPDMAKAYEMIARYGATRLLPRPDRPGDRRGGEQPADRADRQPRLAHRARSPRTTSPATGRSSARRRASTTRASTSGAWARRRAAARPSARR